MKSVLETICNQVFLRIRMMVLMEGWVLHLAGFALHVATRSLLQIF